MIVDTLYLCVIIKTEIIKGSVRETLASSGILEYFVKDVLFINIPPKQNLHTQEPTSSARL